MTIKLLKFLLAVGLCLLWATFTFPADFVVLENGVATDKTASAWQGSCALHNLTSEGVSMSWANSNASAGDTVYVCPFGGDGVLTNRPIAPVNSGSSWAAMITYEVPAGESVQINTTSGDCVTIDTKNYIKIKNFSIGPAVAGSRWLILDTSDDIWIDGNTFTCSATGCTSGQVYIDGDSDRVVFTNNVLTGEAITDARTFDMFRTYNQSGSILSNSFLFAQNTFGHSTHGLFDTSCTSESSKDYFWIFYDNLFNDKWHSVLVLGSYWDCSAYVCASENDPYDCCTGDGAGICGCAHRANHFLVDSNTFENVGEESDTNPNGGETQTSNPALYLKSSFRSIFRFNIFKSFVGGQIFQFNNHYVDLQDLPQGWETWIYHNTAYDLADHPSLTGDENLIYYAGRMGAQYSNQSTIDYIYSLNNIFSNVDGDISDREFRMFESRWDVLSPDNPIGTKFYNNLFYDDTGSDVPSGAFRCGGDQSHYTVTQQETNCSASWFDNIPNSNPLFVNPPSDLRISSNSPARDAGQFLAEISNRTGYVLTIGNVGDTSNQDAVYAFYTRSNYWQGSLPHSSILSYFPPTDTVYDDDGYSCQLKENGIVYASGTIELDNSCADYAQFNTGDLITVVNYNESAPDIGAFEYVGITPPPNDFGRTIRR